MYRMSIRVRLTLWYSLVFASALLSLGGAALWMVNRAFDELQAKELQQRVRSVRLFLEARPAGETPEQLSDVSNRFFDIFHGKKWLQIVDEHGHWVYRAPRVSAAYPHLVLPQQAPKEGSYFTYKNENDNMCGVIQPITVHGVSYTVQTGHDLNATALVLSRLRSQLLLLTALGLCVSSLSGYFMSSKALAPIATITSEAQRINDKNLNSRLPTLKTRDELAALSDTLNQMLGRIEAGYQSVRSFTANAAHELRSPVARLRANAEVTLAFPRDAEYYRNACEKTLVSAIHMSQLIDQFLSLARADAGVTVLQSEPVNLPDLFEETREEWAAQFADFHIQFQCDCEAEEVWVEGDYVALKRLLHILIENAWRYTPHAHAVTLALHQRLDDSAKLVAEISVSDTGIGISAEDQSRIFGRFYRVARPLRGEFAGSGVGLALGQWIATRHHSRIEVQSCPGEGSRFSMLLPVISANQMQEPESRRVNRVPGAMAE